MLIGNDVEFSGKHKGVFERSFSNKDLGEATYILSIKIYRDRSRRLIYFQWVHTLTRFWSSSKWNNQRRSSCLCCKVCSWVKTQNPTMAENRKRMKSHSLCLSHRFYKVCYAVNQTYCIPCSVFGKGIQFWSNK